MNRNINKNQYNELLIGCGRNHNKKVYAEEKSKWTNLTTLDINPDHNPDVLWDLTQIPLPFDDNSFDEIHAYQVLEHTGQQGDYKFFFAQFSDFWRILKPDGLIIGNCPMWNSVWAFGDPSHTRIIQKQNFIFLDQAEYTKQIGKTNLSDFRYIYQADFVTCYIHEDEGGHLTFILKAIKPSRISI